MSGISPDVKPGKESCSRVTLNMNEREQDFNWLTRGGGEKTTSRIDEVITWQKIGEALCRWQTRTWRHSVWTHREAERGSDWCSNRKHMSSRRSRERRGLTADRTPRPSLPSIHLLRSWCVLPHWMHSHSAVAEGKSLRCCGSLDMDYSTQESSREQPLEHL